MKDLKEKTIRGGMARLCAQGANFFLRLISLMILARLLGPKDFGLVGMVTAFTDVLTLFRDFGLSSAAIQRPTVTNEQISTLFWINLSVGILLGLLAVAGAPVIAAFYHEPRLSGIAAVVALGFLFNGAGIQHSVLLQRQMRFTALAIINTVGLIAGSALAIAGAKAGFGYWSIVAMTVTVPLVSTVGFWLATAWVPGLPRRRVGIRSMMRFGGTITLTGLIVYVASNLEKVLLGRFWGVDAVGLYGRAYQLINIPTSNLNSAAGEVAFSALSRLQDDPARRRNYFLKGFSLVLGLTLPITIACAFFANDVVLVLLGAKWKDAAPIFRWLAPTILVFAIANPLSWLLIASGRIGRLMRMSLVIAPIMILGYIIGLPYGPRGVACAYSVVMTLWLIPLITWAVHGTEISFLDVVRTASSPLVSSVVAGGVALGVGLALCQSLSPLVRLVIESTILLTTFLGALMSVATQRSLYLGLFRELIGSLSTKEKAPASA
ncbi:lipopolysaccharide biosynthesis protein [Tunturiibacter psychrotolerans]|uniref:lipopolysaccharide biosynthesis protein n=1 Tax=Tunturiibacter psychrotolerans TaxID=3069686 RepID=UPI003D1AAD67